MLLKGKGKEIAFIGLSCFSVASLFGCFAGDLEGWEVWKQSSINRFGQPSDEIFIISEKSKLPYGLDTKKAEKIASNYKPELFQKLVLMLTSGMCATTALLLANIDFDQLEIEAEAHKLKMKGKKEQTLEGIKQRLALASLAQREQFKLELQALMELTGGDETMIADEVNASDKFTNAAYMMQDGHSIDFVIQQQWGLQPDNPEFENIKAQFQQWLKGDAVDG